MKIWQVGIGFQLVLWWLTFGFPSLEETTRLRGGLYTKILLLSLSLIIACPTACSMEKASLNSITKRLLLFVYGIFQAFLVFLICFSVMLLVAEVGREDVYVSPKKTHSITIVWNPISGGNTVYCQSHNCLLEQKVGVFVTNAKASAAEATRIHWTEDETAFVWEFGTKRGLMPVAYQFCK